MSARLCPRLPATSSLCLNDSSFGPQSLCRSFDLTVAFEASILQILPSTIFICVATPYIWTTKPWRNFNTNAVKNPRSIAIILSFCFLICTAALSFVSWLTSSPDLPSPSKKLVAAALGLTTVSSILFVIVGLSAIFSKTVAFSLALYQFILLILQTAPLRTFILYGDRSTSKFFLASFASLFGATTLVVIALSIPGRTIGNRLSEGDGLFNHLFVLWALPLMWKGRKKEFSVDYELDPAMESTELYRRFKIAWDREMNQHPGHPLLARALFRAFSPTFLSTIPAAMTRALAQVVQPLLVNAAIKFVSSYALGSRPEPSQWGWALAGVFALIFLALSGATSLYFYSVAKTGGYIRGALIEAMFRKALVLRADSVTEATGGDPMNLMSSDVERITTHLDLCHQIWYNFIIVGLGLYILYTQLGLGPFISTLPIIFLVLISTPLLSRKVGPLEGDITALCDKRVRLISSILRQVKGVKLAALESEVEDRVKAARTAELGARKRFWDRFAIVVSLTNTTLNLLSLFCLGTYSVIFFLGHGPPLSTARLFTAYATLTIISASLLVIGQGLPAVTQAYVSVQRIERYLSSPESKRQEDRDWADPSKDIPKALETNLEVPEKPRSVFLHVESSVSSLSAPIRGERDQTLIFDGARIAWGEKVVLDGLDATICLGQLTMVIGRVASGKSTLLAALLGETNILAGRVSFPTAFRRGIGYCSQSPWIQGSLSVRDNVLFASAMDQGWYERVIAACALDVDLGSMAGGDLALARGLSGGQKARVALARAVYSRLEVLVLDDVFAALDPETSSAVFSALFGGEGLLRGKTVVLATNQFAQLKYSDWIIALYEIDETQQGTYAEFLASNNSTGRLIRDNIHHPGSGEQIVVIERSSAESSPASEESDNLEADDVQLLESSSESTSRKTYLHYMRSVGWYRMSMYAILLLVAIGIQVATPVFLQIWSTFNDTHSARSARSRTGIFLGSYAVFEVLYSISITVLFYYVIMVVTLRASANLHFAMFSALMKTTIEFFSTTHPGQIISRFSQDIFILDDLFPISFYDFGYQLMRLVGSAILMIVSVPYLAVVVAIVVGIAYLVQKFYLSTAKKLRRFDLSSKAPLYTLFQETIELNGLLTIRAASAEHRLMQSNTLLLAQSQRPFYLTTIASVWFASTIGLMTATVNTAIVILAVATRRSTNAGLLAVGLTQAVSLQDTITLMLTSWTQLEISAVALERNLEYSNLAPEQDTHLTVPDVDGAWPFKGDVKFTDVFAKYTIDGPPVLRGISFHASAGSKFAIVGRTGGGKSTLLMALLRALYTEGEIFIDDINVMDVAREHLRKSITVIPQDPFVLAGTVRQNVDIAGQKSDTEIWAALEAVQLKPTVIALEGNLDHELTSNGRSLSQGQLQLLAMARAVLCGSKVAIFDEPTANIDPETDIIIQNVIRSSFQDCTVFAIVHRLENIMDFDQVIVLDAGHIVERGKPSELVQMEGSIFKQLSNGHHSFR
ncbi:P-loop containing nucleoside triphosphate hydrolase protein [Mycena venus]|uniref:P-loop containing nucleoside triphosphate hydrolase protein n=1 Tax=Mycena venus TaxID=2733690 RepID=A0A8H7CC95_9AGAR|nr:P-loop containing nucleoside triphosphate hydrolase protein [Mycena venus]